MTEEVWLKWDGTVLLVIPLGSRFQVTVTKGFNMRSFMVEDPPAELVRGATVSLCYGDPGKDGLLHAEVFGAMHNVPLKLVSN